jgi:transcriptional regulator with XRE-family HTH domain
MAGRPKPLTAGGSGLAAFGSMLRMYRQAAGLNITQFGTKINYSASTISETEHGKSRCDRLLAERADTELGTGEALTHLWDLLVKAIVYPKWFDWPAYEARDHAPELPVVGGRRAAPDAGVRPGRPRRK